MARPFVLVVTGCGINCEEETAHAFNAAGASPRVVHINDIIESPRLLEECQIVSFPGGFSYGDDTGSGRALANRIKNNLVDELHGFLERDTLMLGICNGFQVMVNLGIVPALNSPMGESEAALEKNGTARYQCRWVDLEVNPASPCVFTRGLRRLHIPVAHGEGNFYAKPGILDSIEKKNIAVMRYVKPDGSPAGGEFPYNPNGSLNDIASICDESGRRMGMMPHPERNITLTQRDDWTLVLEKAKRDGAHVSEESDGMAIFKNAVKYFE